MVKDIVRNKLTHVKELSKINYYQIFFSDAGNNTSKTWQTIKKVLQKENKVLFCPNIIIDNDQKIALPTDICNDFHSVFTNVGKNLAAGIKHTGKIKTYKDYLGPRQQPSIFLTQQTNLKSWKKSKI